MRVLLFPLMALVFSTARAAAPAAAIVREPLFDGPILHWEVQLTRSEIRKLRGSGWGRGDRPEAVCTVRAGTNVWTNVAVHLKGAAGSFRPFDDTPALTLNFGKLQEGQTCFGHRKIHLNNSVQDGGRMDEMLASEMYLRSGIPTPRATHGFVSINGRQLGLYVVKGGWDKPFLKQHFGSAKANFYDGGFVQDINVNLERDSGEGDPDWADLQALRSALAVASPGDRLAALEKVLDVDRFLTLAALQVLIDDWDGYVRNRNNYRVYNDPRSGKLVFLPHGMDQLWRTPRSSFRPAFNGLVARRLFSIPGMSRRLGDRMKELSGTVFNAAFVDDVFARAEQRLTSAFRPGGLGGQDDMSDYVMASIRDTRQRIDIRLAAFSGSSLPAARRAAPDATGRIVLDEWLPQREGLSAVLRKRDLPEGRHALAITASAGGAVGSWRTRVLLPWGRYRLEARARCRDVFGGGSDGRGSGVGIRISGSSRNGGLSGTSDWRKLAYEFEVREGAEGADPGRGEGVEEDSEGREVVLVAELRAEAGEVEFDAEAFRLVRLE